jgi:hypothetical protein
MSNGEIELFTFFASRERRANIMADLGFRLSFESQIFNSSAMTKISGKTMELGKPMTKTRAIS